MKYTYFGDRLGPISLQDLNAKLRLLGFEIYDSGRDSSYGENAWYLDIRKREDDK